MSLRNLMRPSDGTNMQRMRSAIFRKKSLYERDRFDNGLGSWALDQTGGTVSILTRDNSNKLVLNDTNASAVVSATKSISMPPERYHVTADMYAESGAKFKLELLNSSDAVLMYLEVDGSAGQGEFDTDNDTPSTLTFAAGTYKNITVLVDPIGNTARCWYTVGESFSPAGWDEAGTAAKSFSGDTVAKVRFITDSVTTGECRVDQLLIYVPKTASIGMSWITGWGSGSPSSTGGWNVNPWPTGSRGSTAETPTHQFQYKLGNMFSPFKFIANRGVPAERIDQGLLDVDHRIIDQGFSSCFVLYSTNSILNGRSAAAIQADLTTLWNSLEAADVRPIICTAPPYTTFTAPQNVVNDTVNAWIRTQATNDRPLIELYNNMVIPGTDDIKTDIVDDDGIHMNHRGQWIHALQAYLGITKDSVSVDADEGGILRNG